jgi:hypothetical protein
MRCSVLNVENEFLENMTRGPASRPAIGVVQSRRHPLLLLLLALLGAGLALPLMAQTATPAADDTGDFGQYVVNHQDTLAPFFTKNAGDFFRLAIPALIGLAGWVIFISMVVGWGLDVLMSRAYAFFYAPAFADWKRAIIYATGSLFLSFLYAALLGLVIVVLLGIPQAQVFILLAVLVLGIVAIAAQIVWIIYMFRTTLGITILFYIAVAVVHVVATSLISGPVMGSRASPDITNFVDNAVTPRVQAEAKSTREQLASVTGGRDSAQTKVTESQEEITQAESQQANLAKEIEEKKNSDIYTLAQLIKERARGELDSAREGLAAFPGKFPGSSLLPQAREQLDAVNGQIATNQAQRKQEEADEARVEAQNRADLLARAAKGQATLSQMRPALIGKSRAQVKDLLGPPSDTGPDQWNYQQQMIVNPLTGEQTGLTVFFSEGMVQTIDYNRNH